MRHSKTEEAVYRGIADDSGLSLSEVKRAVQSFFDTIALDARKMPFDNLRKIYSRESFDKYGCVRCIPYIGRLGTSYSRYLAWRKNEADKIEFLSKKAFSHRRTQEELEEIAGRALNGEKIVEEKIRTVPYQRVWIVRQEGKKQARQVLPKKK